MKFSTTFSQVSDFQNIFGRLPLTEHSACQLDFQLRYVKVTVKAFSNQPLLESVNVLSFLIFAGIFRQ